MALSDERQQAALSLAAAWLGSRLGLPGPAPVGPEAADHARGPMLIPAWDFPDTPAPAIVLEGYVGWADEASGDPRLVARLAQLGMMAECWGGFALVLYEREGGPVAAEQEKALFGIDPETPDEVFEGYHFPEWRWNGWACPEFDRDQVERIITWSHRVNQELGPDSAATFAWDGDVLVQTDRYGDEVEVQRIPRNDRGRYPVGAYGWTWSEVELPEGADLATFLTEGVEAANAYVAAANAALHAAYDAGATPEEALAASKAAGTRAITDWRA